MPHIVPVEAPAATQPGPARSIVGRLAGAATALALLAVATLFAITYAVAASGLTHALAATVDADVAGLADIHASGGRAELIRRIADRHALVALGGREAHYLLVDRGRRITGDLSRWPALAASRSEHGTIRLESGRTAYARATRLGPTLDLLVAREDDQERAILRRLELAFAAGGAAIVAAVFALALWRFRRLSQRMERINAAYRRADRPAIAALIGDRMPDEIGELARHSGDALSRLARMLDAQRHAIDHVAHELRSPLHRLDGRLSDLARADPRRAAAFERARDDIRGVTDMLDALLDIADSEADRGSTIGLAEFDLSAVAAALGELYATSMEEAGLAFTLDVVPGVTMVGDRTQIIHMLSNLLDNAIKYVPAGARVALAVAPGPIVAVYDDGPGIGEELRPYVFDRFRRGRDTGGKPGYGLGLALARAIAQRHKLSLTLDGDARGCRFVIAPESR